MSNILDTGIKNVKNVLHYSFGSGVAFETLSNVLELKRKNEGKYVIFFVDEFFQNNFEDIAKLSLSAQDAIIFVSTKDEPSTEYINSLKEQILKSNDEMPCAIVGMGGGITLDCAKAVANLLTNDGRAEDYQGWDLVTYPGIYKIAIPTISGTGAEATRTCVMTNKKNGLKLGMNSDYTVYDQIILDPNLTETVPRDQYFYTGMDSYIHCVESLSGSYRNAIGDSYSEQTIKLCREIFDSNDMKSEENRAKLMVASYLGGCAIATSYVGIIHPFSAGLSVVLGLHHCVANCITMRAMEEFYPEAFYEFWVMVEKQNISVPKDICSNLPNEQYDLLFNSTVVHEKPLTNALGSDFKTILSKEKVIEIFKRM